MTTSGKEQGDDETGQPTARPPVGATIVQMMARDGEDPEQLYLWFLAGFKKMAGEVKK